MVAIVSVGKNIFFILFSLFTSLFSFVFLILFVGKYFGINPTSHSLFNRYLNKLLK